jgi:uncharacterized membrane protein YukC
MKILVDLSQKRLPAVLIIILVAILIFQYVTNEPNAKRLIDSETCELYIKYNQINGKKYLDEYDPKCLEAKGLTHPIKQNAIKSRVAVLSLRFGT